MHSFTRVILFVVGSMTLCLVGTGVGIFISNWLLDDRQKICVEATEGWQLCFSTTPLTFVLSIRYFELLEYYSDQSSTLEQLNLQSDQSAVLEMWYHLLLKLKMPCVYITGSFFVRFQKNSKPVEKKLKVLFAQKTQHIGG